MTSANLVRVNLTRLKKTDLRVSTSHERHVLAGSAKVFGLSVALFLRLFSSHWLASRLFSHAVECNDSFIQDVRLTRGCLKSPSTSTDLRFFLFRPPDLNSKWSVVYTARISDANLKDLLEWSTSKHNVTFVKLSTCWKVLIDDWFKESWCSLTFGLFNVALKFWFCGVPLATTVGTSIKTQKSDKVERYRYISVISWYYGHF